MPSSCPHALPTPSRPPHTPSQDELLQGSGLRPEALHMAPEQVEQSLKVKLGQIQEDTTDHNFNYSSLSREAVLASRLSAASKQLLTAPTLPLFIRAALDHVAQHTAELQQLRAPAGAKNQEPEEGGKAPSPQRRGGRGGAGAGGGVSRRGGSTAPGGGGGSGTDAGDEDGGSSTQDGSSSSRGSTEMGGGWTGRGGVGGAGGRGGRGHATAAAAAQAAAEAAAALEAEQWRLPPPKQARTVTLRRQDVMVTEEWMTNFVQQMEAIERSTPDGPPDGSPPLPPLPPGDMDAGAYVRSRLERLWSVLGMPPQMRLDMVLHFTARERALTFATSLELWETAATAVLAREAHVEALVAVQREMEAGAAERLSLEAVSGLCCRLLAQTRWVEVLSRRLAVEAGWELTRGGQPYPGPEVITAGHLRVFLEQLRAATQVSGLRP
ncbi:hypothetical protein Agub_g1783 [Astrephomene gubernaculifera]|uniref:Uncharacterized protein n=1 Tax=Astrephomene gubernaculifera TaxID=47775 RepID=A0AAD3HI29_9CHLO|nr:hypothetical protein Agub_g1783 [Astrephomene gubernaculifera]